MPSYTGVSISGYNATPPIDDGTVTSANKILWATIKTKLADPIQTAISSINTNIGTAFNTNIPALLATAEANLAVVQAEYNAAVAVLDAPSTTAMLFKQTAAPTGWTKGATHNNKALRLVSGTASSGGSTAFTSVFTSRTITSSNMPGHTHSWASGTITASLSHTTLGHGTSTDTSGGNAGPGANIVRSVSNDRETIAATGSVSGTTTESGSGTAMDFAVRYADLIIATKD